MLDRPRLEPRAVGGAERLVRVPEPGQVDGHRVERGPERDDRGRNEALVPPRPCSISTGSPPPASITESRRPAAPRTAAAAGAAPLVAARKPTPTCRLPRIRSLPFPKACQARPGVLRKLAPDALVGLDQRAGASVARRADPRAAIADRDVTGVAVPTHADPGGPLRRVEPLGVEAADELDRGTAAS